jgi:uncharacterized protein (TIGR04206 family)
MDARRRLALVALVGLLPWTLVGVGGAWTVVHPLGLFNLTPPRNFVFVYSYLFERTTGVPPFFELWPVGIVVYAAALGSAALGLLDREDQRLTAGLLVLVGLTQFSVTWEFLTLPTRQGYVAVPVATLTTFALVWWVYWPAFGRIFTGVGRR